VGDKVYKNQSYRMLSFDGMHQYAVPAPFVQNIKKNVLIYIKIVGHIFKQISHFYSKK
jgi:hypothetical protein